MNKNFDIELRKFSEICSKLTQSDKEHIEYRKKHNLDIFVWGLSRAGKTTVSEHLRDNLHKELQQMSCTSFMMLRQAGTIKRLISEKNLMSFIEIDNIKDNPDSDIRSQHHEVSDMFIKYDNPDVEIINSLYDIKTAYNIVTGRAHEFEIFHKSDTFNVILSDVRTLSSAMFLLSCGWTGIFLSRVVDDKQTSHFTDNDILRNGHFEQMLNTFSPALMDEFISKNRINIISDRYYPEIELRFDKVRKFISPNVNSLKSTAIDICKEVYVNM